MRKTETRWNDLVTEDVKEKGWRIEESKGEAGEGYTKNRNADSDLGKCKDKEEDIIKSLNFRFLKRLLILTIIYIIKIYN